MYVEFMKGISGILTSTVWFHETTGLLTICTSNSSLSPT